MVNVTRVCALLSIESKTVQEIKKFLNLSVDEIQKIIEIIKKEGEFKHEVRQFQKPYDNQQAEQISLMV
ncbi:hypothetical protein DKC15_009415 [Acinetobacter pittii]|nr:hypothetical protein DKC15_009415 [Acinetobacter pittii]